MWCFIERLECIDWLVELFTAAEELIADTQTNQLKASMQPISALKPVFLAIDTKEKILLKIKLCGFLILMIKCLLKI